IGLEHGFKHRFRHGPLSQPVRPMVRTDHDRHSIVQWREEVIGGSGDDGEGSKHVALRRAPAIPQAGKKDQKRTPGVTYAVKVPYFARIEPQSASATKSETIRHCREAGDA